MPDPRFVQIEEKIAHLEQLHEQLDGVIREAFDRMDRIEKQLGDLRTTVEDNAAASGEEPPTIEEDRPPHW